MNEFIGMLAPYAMKHGIAKNVLPSLIIAQGILETGGGKSELAREANNLFGIKKGMGWDGDVYPVITGEYRKNDAGEDEYYEIVAEFRKYNSFEGAVIDLCAKYNDMPRYSAVLGASSFAEVAQAVKDAGYATDPNYPSKLVNIYNTYDLGRFEAGFTETNKEELGMKIVIDAGHFPNTPGKRSPAGEREWHFNDRVAKACIAELNRYQNVQILRVDSATTDVPLSTRAARANSWQGAVYVSIHHNANLGTWGTWTGVETFVYTTSSDTSGSMRLAKQVHPRIVAAMGLRDRGIKKANFAVLRETRMPAILTEGGYMDSTIDIVKMRNATVMAAQGRAIAQGIVAYGNLKLKATTAPAPAPAPTPIVNPAGELFRVRKSWSDVGSQLGAFSDLNGAIDIAKTKAGYNVYDSKGKQVYPAKVAVPEQPKTDNLYRVRKLWSDVGSQLGAFADLEGAIVLADKNITYNVYDGKGDLAYDPRKAKAEREKAEADAKAKAEADAAMAKLVSVVKAADIPVLDVAIVINSGGDYASAKLVHDATGIPIYERSGVGNRRIAKHVIGIGGLPEGIAMNGDVITMLSGKSRFDTEEAVKAFVARVR